MINNAKIKQSIPFVVLISAFILVYSNTVIRMIADWSVDDNFSHGFLVPFISIYMIWYKREKIAQVRIQPNKLGFFLLVLGMGMHLVGNIGAELFTQRVSIIMTLIGLILILFGTKVLKEVIVPVCYLVMMIPIPAILWNQVAFPLQLFAAKLSTYFIHLFGIAVLREGNILHLANTTLEVVDACSGLRSLTSMIALSAAYAYISTLRNSGKWILFLSAIPIALTVNIIRLTVTAILSRHYGPEMAQGFLHDMSGMLIFIIALILLYLTHNLINRFKFFNINSNNQMVG